MQISPNRRRHTFSPPAMNHLFNHSKVKAKGRNSVYIPYLPSLGVNLRLL